MMTEPNRSGSQFGIWSHHFFRYLQTEKKDSNPGLLQLIDCLEKDGRQEMAASVFNYLRTQEWKTFCKYQNERKRQLKKTLSTSVKNLKRATQHYSKLLVIAPETCIGTLFVGAKCLSLSDVLEAEAYLLAAQARMEHLSAGLVYTQGQKHSQSIASRARVARALTTLSAVLKLTASNYRTLRKLHSCVPFDYLVEPMAATQFIIVLQAEQVRLRRALARIDTAFNTKRFGIPANLAIPIRLQKFVEEFALRRKPYMPNAATKRLNEIDLADLIEAGKAALGLPEDSTITNPTSIGRAIERFRRRKSNEQTLLLWQRSAREACVKLRSDLPSPSAI